MSDPLGGRRVKMRTLETARDDVDDFMGANEPGRPWQVFELTQGHNVREWIENPARWPLPNLEDLRRYALSCPRPVSILDVGCYGGYLYDYLRAGVFETDEDFEYVGIDVDMSSVLAAKEAHGDASNATFCYGDVLAPDLAYFQAFDIVWCSRVLIHIPHFERAFYNLCDMARAAAVIVLRVRDEAQCAKILETDAQTGKEAVYYTRSVTPQMVEDAARLAGVDFKIITRGAYDTVIAERRAG